MRLSPWIALVACVLQAGAPPARGARAYTEELAAWRKAREARLAAEGGWLSVVGLDWLEEGDNRFGSAAGNPVRFPEGKGPAVAGTLRLQLGVVTVVPDPAAGLTLDGQPLAERVLRTDADGRPDVLRLGSLAFHVIKRGERFAVRLKDAESPARRAFKGVPAYPARPDLRVEGRFIPYDPPREIPIVNVLGAVERMRCPGRVEFRLGGRTLSLEPVLEGDAKELFFIFRDRTCGRETYPAGRFLYADLPREGKVLLDFNKAVNPPCAFTAFATCPLPPRQNQLEVAIRAGEKDPGGH